MNLFTNSLYTFYSILLDCVGLLCSIVRHVQLNPDELEAFIRLSLPMVRAGGGIAASYMFV